MGGPRATATSGSCCWSRWRSARSAWLDDYQKLIAAQLQGPVGARPSIPGSPASGSAAALLLYCHRARSPVETQLIVPFFKNVRRWISAGCSSRSTYFVIVGSSNAVNLTDGLDGLAIVPTVHGRRRAWRCSAYVAGNARSSPTTSASRTSPGAGEVTVFCGAMVGAGLGFLWFNAYPAQVFMGDVGALALGAALGTVAVVVRQELVLFVMGGVFVMETRVGDPAGGLVQADRQAHLPHGAAAPPLRTQGLAGAEGHRPLLDHHHHSGAGRSGDPEDPMRRGIDARRCCDWMGTTLVVGLGQSGLSRGAGAGGAGRGRARSTDSRARPAGGWRRCGAECPGRCPVTWAGSTRRCSPTAARLLVSPGVAVATPVVADAAARGVPVWGDIELLAPADRRRPVAAITGSNGKSTVTTLLGRDG
ncbi:MAG: hypothetical protein MZV65_19880 [Chromatiales bacterium]|nr:hypothetical protein [Chromatiales bacterium]